MCSEPKTPHSGIALASLQLHAARMPSRNQKHIQFDMRVQQQHCLDWRLLKQSITHNAVFRFLVANNCAARCWLGSGWLRRSGFSQQQTTMEPNERTKYRKKFVCRAHTPMECSWQKAELYVFCYMMPGKCLLSEDISGMPGHLPTTRMYTQYTDTTSIAYRIHE